MRIKEYLIFFFIFLVIVGIFFYKSIIYGYVPFPGDLLISEYNPWKTYSYLGYVPGSYPNKAQYFDVARQLYPWKTLVLDQLRAWKMPLWNPYNFSGAPLLANFQSAVFYPFNILYFLLPQIMAWSILVMLQPFLALLFTFLYARKIGISRLGSYFGAFSFAFSSFMTVWLEYNSIGHVILWLPLILLSLEKLFEKKTMIWALILVASIFSSLFAGHIQIFVYLYLFTIFYCVLRILSVYKSLSRIKNAFIFFVTLFIIPLGTGAIQLLPGFELIRESARSAHSYDFFIHKVLIQVWQLIMIFVPDFFGNPATRNYWIKDTYVGDVIYIGIIPIFFVFLTFFKLKNFYVRFFWITVGLLLIFLTLNPLTQFLHPFDIPFISGSASNLSVFIMCFSLSILCGFGVDFFSKEIIIFRKLLRLVTPLIIIFVGLWIVVLILPKLHVFEWGSSLTISLRNLLYSTIIFSFALIFLLVPIFKKNSKSFILIILLLLHGFDLWHSFEKFNPFSPKETIFPNAPVFNYLQNISGVNRIWGYGAASIEANFATQYSLYSPDGYDPLYPRRYGEFIQAARDGKIQTNFTAQTRSDAVIQHGFGELDFSSNVARLKILDLLGVKYVLDRVENKSTEKTFPIDRFKLIYEKDGWKIFENLKAMRRAFLVSDYKVFKSGEEFEKIFFDEDFDPSRTVLLEEYLGFDRLGGGKDRYRLIPGKATTLTPPMWRVDSYNPNKVIISVSSNNDTLLFLSDTYYPGWKAFVDGKETKIYRANYAFRGVSVSKGEHEIKFVYDPDTFRVGLVISAISFISTSVLLILLFIRPKYVTT